MTLNTINKEKDIMHTKTVNHRDRARETSNNLNSRDIEGMGFDAAVNNNFRC
jgi:hypothetical protein